MPAKRTGKKSKKGPKATRGLAPGPPSPAALAEQFDALGAAASIDNCLEPIKHRPIIIGGNVLIRTPQFMKFIKKSGGPSGMTDDGWREVELLALKGLVVDIRQRPADSEDYDDPLIKVRWHDGLQAVKHFGCIDPEELKKLRKEWKPRQLILTDNFDVVSASSVYKMFDVQEVADGEDPPTDDNTWFLWGFIKTQEEEDEQDGKMKMDVDIKAPQGDGDDEKGNDGKEGASTSDVDMQPPHDEKADHGQEAKDGTTPKNAGREPAHEVQQSQGKGKEKRQEGSQDMRGAMPTGEEQDDDGEDGEKKQIEKDLDVSRQKERLPQRSSSHPEATVPKAPTAVVEEPCPPERSSGQQQGQKTGVTMTVGGGKDKATSSGNVLQRQGAATIKAGGKTRVPRRQQGKASGQGNAKGGAKVLPARRRSVD